MVTYGSRVHLLSKTIEAILKDVQVAKLVVVDNASYQKDELRALVELYGDRIELISHKQNIGSAGGFAAGIRFMQGQDVDFIYLSDDDVIISENFGKQFMLARKVIGMEKVVLLARRASFWAGTDVHYRPETEPRPRRYFNIFTSRIIIVFLKSLLGIKDVHGVYEPARFFPIIPSRGWAYAGVLLPKQAIMEAPLPDESLGLYLDDIVYSWGVIDAGFPSFALMEPHLEDLEMTHGGSHTSTGLFSPSVSSTKIYYETRNRVRVSLKYGKANSALLKIQVMVWYIAVCVLGVMRIGLQRETFAKMNLIGEALRAGFDHTRPVPEGIAVRI